VSVEIRGQRVRATLRRQPFYDPSGSRLRDVAPPRSF
jgi:glycine cleavage system aminomethyltransferase T